MLITIQNDKISLTVDTLGAQMMNLKSSSGREFLWQGDPKYWAKRAPTLFPFIGRLTNNSYRFHGRVYPMGSHGFAATSEFSVAEQTEDGLTLVLDSNDESRKQYPLEFSFSVSYQLCGSSVKITYGVRNRSDEVMPFGVGGHPGFCVPMNEGERFEDYYLEFSQPCQPDRVGFTPKVYLNGHDEAYPLQDGKRLPLSHEMFDEDAVILKNMAKEVTLRSKTCGCAVTVGYPQMNYLGIWHKPLSDAPYVCIEPWTSLPSRQDVVEEFTCKSDMLHLLPGKTYENCWTITVTEG